MSDLTQDLTSITPALGDAAAVAKFGSDVISLFSQPLRSAQLDKPANEAKDRIEEYEAILQEDTVRVPVDLGVFLNRLCLDAQLPVGELSGKLREVPVEFVTAFVTGLINLIELRERDAIARSIAGQSTAPVAAAVPTKQVIPST